MKIVLSKYTHLLPLAEGRFLLCHGVLGQRMLISRDLERILRKFVRPMSIESAERRIGASIRPLLERLMSGGFLVDSSLGAKEDEGLLEVVADLRNSELGTSQSVGRERGLHSTMTPEDLQRDVTLECHVGLSAECFLERTAGVLRGVGLRHGVNIRATFVRGMGDFRNLAELDLVIARHVSSSVIESLYDSAHLLTEEERKDRKRIFLDEYRKQIDHFLEQTRAVVLAHTLPFPNVASMGIYVESKAREGLFDLLGGINAEIRSWARGEDRIHIFDEDWFVGNLGRDFCLDSSVVVSSHLGPLEMWTPSGKEADAFQLPEHLFWNPAKHFDVPRENYLEEALALEYVNFVRILKGVGKKKLIIVDLDHTLWPGLIGEDDFRIERLYGSAGPFGLFVGLHQALKFLKARGILLAIASKNNEADVLEKWKYQDASYESRLLTLKDFVAHRINWKPKPGNIVDLVQELDLTLDAAAFIDDNPVERERVKKALPPVLVLGDNPAVRHQLLTLPEFQTLHVTAEGAERTEMVKGQLQRKKMAASFSDPEIFLRDLSLSYKIEERLTDENNERVHELILRTNQFNVTTKRYPMEELARWCGDPARACFFLHLKDRFTHYGLVGVALCEGNRIDSFLLSCRVLGMRVEDFFLRYVMDALQRKFSCREIIGQFEPTKKNAVAEGLYPGIGFERMTDGRWRYPLAERGLPPSLDGFFRRM